MLGGISPMRESLGSRGPLRCCVGGFDTVLSLKDNNSLYSDLQE